MKESPRISRADWYLEIDHENIIYPEVSGSFVALILRVRSQAFRLGSAHATSRFSQRFRQTTFAVAGSHRVFMESLDTTILNTAVPAIAAALASGAAQHEGGSLQLYFEPRGLHSGERLDGGSLWNPPGVFLRDRHVHYRIDPLRDLDDIHMLVICRILQGCGGAMMVPVGRLTMVRTFAKSELIRAMSFVAIPALIGPMLGPRRRRTHRRFLHWRMIFFINVPIGLLGLYFIYRHLPDYREAYRPTRYRRYDSLWRRRRAAVVRLRSLWRAHSERCGCLRRVHG